MESRTALRQRPVKKGAQGIKTVLPVSLRTMNNKSGGYAGGIIVHRYPNGTEFVCIIQCPTPLWIHDIYGYVPDTNTSLVLLSNHMNFVNPLTGLGLNLLERQHDIIKDVPPTELSLWAYLFPVLIGAILISFPSYYGDSCHCIGGHHLKGTSKGFKRSSIMPASRPMSPL